ncbi:MAG: lysylphosphatidylglycerol synthase transmembrane domain-containing protein [Bryobacteraceae bacterium]|jgi:uncharacterized membrane protein YbhN (UPF0104 family)
MPEPARREIASKYLFAATNLIALICFAWVLAGTNWHALGDHVRHLNWWWIAVAVVSDLLVYVLQAWRWCLVLAPVAPIPFWQAVRAVYVGLFANEVLPFKAGEIIRCFLLGRWNDIPISVTLASALIERIFDGFWLIASLGLAVQFTPHVHPFILRAGAFLTLLVAVCAVFLAIAMYWKEQALDAVANTPWLGWAHVLIKDLHLIGHSRYLYFAWLASLPYLLLEVLPIYALLRAYGPPLSGLSMKMAFVMMVFLRLGSAVPQAPSNIGLFNLAAARTLEMFAVAKDMANGFSVLLWAVITLPLLAAGFLAVGVTEVRMSELQRHARNEANGRGR